MYLERDNYEKGNFNNRPITPICDFLKLDSNANLLCECEGEKIKNWRNTTPYR